MYITDIVYLLDVLVVIVYMSYCNCRDYLLLHEDWGECSEDWAGACRWGGGEVEYLTENLFSLRNVPGVLKRPKKIWGGGAKILFGGGGGDFGVFGAPHAPTRGSRGVGKRYTSSFSRYDSGNYGNDFEKYLNRLQLDTFSLLVNFTLELAHIMTPYDLLSAKQATST